MQWPYWFLAGTLYGLMLSGIAFVGDLTVSMMKRDAKLKDTGNIFPGHGGLLDRIDSYMFTAPASFFFCKDVLPFLQRLKDSKLLSRFY
jgi:phosphatidate cytidylyltransferase